jgi:hypothetical protein
MRAQVHRYRIIQTPALLLQKMRQYTTQARENGQGLK